MTDFQASFSVTKKLIQALSTVIRGRTDTLQLIISALVADGHVLLEDYPGSGKTVLTKTLGRLIAKDRFEEINTTATDPIVAFKRIQFTPDLLPGDVLGVNIFDPKTGSFQFIHGPVFAHVVLADEINRTGPKVQAAFLECMAEKQITLDNVTHHLDKFFFVIGTQNPLDIAGTYPLPLVQLDRFLLKIPMTYVDKQTEIEILEDHQEIQSQMEKIAPVCSRSDIIKAQDDCRNVAVSKSLREAIIDLVQETRKSPLLHFGASTRAAVMLQQAVRGWALVNQREFATEDDLKTIAPYVLMHRLKFHGSSKDNRENFNKLAAPILEKLISKSL
jgi:MoxR-like ATPase